MITHLGYLGRLTWDLTGSHSGHRHTQALQMLAHYPSFPQFISFISVQKIFPFQTKRKHYIICGGIVNVGM